MGCGANRRYCDAADWIPKHSDPQVRARLPELNLIKAETVNIKFIDAAVNASALRLERCTRISCVC